MGYFQSLLNMYFSYFGKERIKELYDCICNAVHNNLDNEVKIGLTNHITIQCQLSCSFNHRYDYITFKFACENMTINKPKQITISTEEGLSYLSSYLADKEASLNNDAYRALKKAIEKSSMSDVHALRRFINSYVLVRPNPGEIDNAVFMLRFRERDLIHIDRVILIQYCNSINIYLPKFSVTLIENEDPEMKVFNINNKARKVGGPSHGDNHLYVKQNWYSMNISYLDIKDLINKRLKEEG